MILPDLHIQEFANTVRDWDGMDNPHGKIDLEHFRKYPHPIEYRYNSRGFRDAEWPEQGLDQCIWCVGDSFTTGIGSILEHTWPYVLQQRTGIRTITISLDGGSNQWIARRAQAIVEAVNPKNLVILWSYLHRRELPDATLTDYHRREHYDLEASYDEDTNNFFQCVDRAVHPFKEQVVHGLIPGATWPNSPPSSPLSSGKDPRYQALFTDTKFLGQIKQEDWARDKHHFDIVTADRLVDMIIPLLKN